MAKDSDTKKGEEKEAEKKKGAGAKKAPSKKSPPKAEAKKSGPKKEGPKKSPKAEGKEEAKKPSEKKAPKGKGKAEEKKPAPKKKVEEKPFEVQVENFKSDMVAVDVRKEAKCRVEMTVEAVAAPMKESKKVAIRKIAKEVSIPGFRKGKAPSNIIEKKFPRDVSKNWEQEFANVAFREAQTLAKMPLLNGNGNITYKIEKLTSEGGKVVFHFEMEPVIPEIDPSKIKLKEVDQTLIDDEKIEETIKSIQMFYATWNQVEDRGVQEGDFVILDIDDLDQDPPVQAFSNTRFEVKEKGMAKWMRDLVMGLKKGEDVEGTSQPDENESEEVKKTFQKKKVKINVKGIEEAVLPEVNDELAQRVGVPNVAAMKEQLEKLLSKQANEARTKELRELVGEELIANADFEVPASVLEREANHRMTQMFRNGEFSKKWNEQMSEEEKEEQKGELKKQSENAIRLFYICRKIVSDNNLSLPEDEIHPSYDTILEMMFADPATFNRENMTKEQQAIEYSKFMMAKAEDFVIDQVLAKAK